jgi:hypothetical protein
MTEKEFRLKLKFVIGRKGCDELKEVVQYRVYWGRGFFIGGIRNFVFCIVRVSSPKCTHVIFMSFRKREN